MFIKIKAQSSDLEKQYIKERDIFKKKRKGPKLLLSGLLVATVSGYFYYLNSGNPLQTNDTSIVGSETGQNSITVENSVFSADAEPEPQNQSTLITEALAGDKSEQIETTEDTTDNINNSIENDIPLVQTSSVQSDDALMELTNTAEGSISKDLIADQDVNAAEKEIESLAANTDADIENEIDAEELIQEELIEATGTDDLIADDSESASIANTDPEESTITDVDIAQIDAEELIVDNFDEIQVTQETPENLQSNSLEPELNSNHVTQVNEEIEIINVLNVVNVENQAEEISVSEITLDSATNEQILTTATEVDIEDVDEAEDMTVVDSELASIIESDEEDVAKDILEDELATGVVDQNSISFEEASLEITDQSIVAVESEPASISTVDKVKESRPIKAISNMISNVFARDNNGEQEFVADVIEIDFSKVTNSEQEQERVAIVTVTDSDEQYDYQGSSLEELTQTDYETIDTAAIDEVKITTFEVTETDVNEIIEKETQLEPPINSTSTRESIESLFEGVDSVVVEVPDVISLPNKSETSEAIAMQTKQSETDKKQKMLSSAHEDVESVAAVEVPDVISLQDKSETSEAIATQTKQSETDKKQKALSKTQKVVEIESVKVAKIEPKKVNKPDQPAKNNDTTVATTSTDIEAITYKNNSTITIKDLYDQLMADLDQKKTDSAVSKPTTNNGNKEITVKQIYEQITKSAAVAEQAAVTIKNTEAIAALPAENNNNIEVKIDPDKSLAMADPIDSEIPLDPVEQIVISSVDTTSITEEDEPLDPKSEIETASINPKQLTDNKGSTPLMIAALNADLQTVRELVQQGAKVNKRNDWGWTALLNATIKGNKTLVDYLLRNGASPHLADNDGRSPLMAAVVNNHPEIVKTLLDHGADVNKSNRDGWSALSFAAWKGDAASAKYLLEADAFKRHRTSEELTPLQLAKQGGHAEVISLLSL